MKQHDRYVLAEIRKGNVYPFQNIFQQHYPMLCNFAERYVLDINIAEDLVQDLFVKLWENRETIIITTGIKSYLFQSVRNLCLNYLKHDKVHKKFEEHSKHVYSDNFYSDALEEEELAFIIHQAIQNLPPKCREIFEKSRFEEKSHDEISAEMGITKKTINNQLWKALKLVRDHLADNEIIMILFSIAGHNLLF